MYLIVLAFSVFLITVSLSSLIRPAMLRSSLKRLSQKNWLWPVSALRIMLGIAFLMAAEETSAPMVVNIMGLILIVAGILIPVFGKRMLNVVLDTFLQQKDWVLRVCAFLALLFGIFMALSGMPV